MIFDFFGRKKTEQRPAAIAKERLQLVIAYEKADSSPDFLPRLKDELMAVIAKYVKVDQKTVEVGLERKDNTTVLEVSIGVALD